MRSCPVCGASAPQTAAWCGQCYSSLALPATVPAQLARALTTSRFGAVAAVAAVPVAASPMPPHAPLEALPHDAGSSPWSHRTVVLTVAAILVGAIAMGISTLITRDSSLEPAAIIRYALVITLAVYAVVGVLVVTQVTPSVRLRWTDGRPALGAAVGLLVGGALSAVVLAIASALAGHLAPDPRIVLLMSEGDATHIIATVLLTCIAAPLVEEVLFRGLLLESLRRHRTAVAIWVSAAAFAVWHLMPALVPLCYYTLLGGLLGFLYSRLGLVCSMATHFAFNGVLTVAALSLVLSPGPTVNGDGFSLDLPSGWKTAPQTETPTYFADYDSIVAVQGPSGAGMVVVTFATPVPPSVDEIVERASAASPSSAFTPQSGTVRELRLPVGAAVQFEEQIAGHHATVVFLPHAGRSLEFVVETAGSVKAAADVHRILQSVTLTS